MISITAPKKGLGQTVTSINLAIKIGNLLKDRVLLMDSNQYCCGVVDYLSNSSWTRGMDEFKINMESGMAFEELTVHSCSKTVTPRLDIMASSQYLQLDKKDIKELQEYTNRIYPVVLVDTIAGQNDLTNIFLQQSRTIIVILTQDRNEIRLIRDKRLYTKEKDKIIFVINQYRQDINGYKIKYGLKEITEELKGLGFNENPIYTLPYEVALLNECNDSTLLNFSMTEDHQSALYHRSLDKLTRGILIHHGNDVVVTEVVEDEKKKSFVFNLFNL